MQELVSAAQMRAIERKAISGGAVTGQELMERAGEGLVSAVLECWPVFTSGKHRAVVLCGPGNNGGDGFVIARLLAALNWTVEVYFEDAPDKMQPEARRNLERWSEIGPVLPLSGLDQSALLTDHSDQGPTLIVDAIFGTGLARPVGAPWAEAFEFLTSAEWRSNVHVVAVDISSGICSDSGRVLGAGLPSDLTVTFHGAKIGHYLADGPDYCGRVDIRSIGLDDRTGEASSGMTALVSYPRETRLFEKGYDARQCGTAGQGRSRHKFDYGHALICSGPATKTGAARLSARAALRIGAGLVTIASPQDALTENSAQLTAVMLKQADTAEEIENLLSDDRISSVCIGPGFSRLSDGGALDHEHTRQVVKTVLCAKRKTVLDADALSAFAEDPQDLFAALHDLCVMTPHEGEFRRLFPDIHGQLHSPAQNGPAYSKIDAARQAASRAGCVVLFKGPDTVIAEPTGKTAIHAAHYDRAAPWLATAGSGDVLAGFICGLLARGRSVFEAAQQAAWLHTECARFFGPGLIAEDLSEVLPDVLRRIGGYQPKSSGDSL
ncbi:NAD(P)H-hydrate dehydratase [Neptunicoccus cionae]|uniref:NAD(P)H-hydrate dehydratase n=1 Tax=Neptunicoccus cionae TaxID=2035344 RepID=UPI000C784994|nr:NAD(P)H-hydrate dehydratase [Amylibacter cionae]PLS20618.1 bifunctional ADP-dependent NAD(P)H-hydrate dehydratase/NAD(P)H-hydrate epimerase [Amylibacter cionae]